MTFDERDPDVIRRFGTAWPDSSSHLTTLRSRLSERADAAGLLDIAYRTIESETDVSPLTRALERGEVDAICFTSASTARYLARSIGEAELARRLSGSVAASIGPSTSAALRELGVQRVTEARDHTARGLVAAVREALSRS